MRKHRFPVGVKVARFPGMSEISGSISVSGFCFFLSLLYLPCVYHVIHLCEAHVQLSVVLRPRPRALLIPNLNRTSPATLHVRSYNILFTCVFYSRIMLEKT